VYKYQLKALLEKFLDTAKPALEGRNLYSNKAKIAVHYVYLVDNLPGCYRIFVPELFPIVPKLFPQGTAYQTRKGDPTREKKLINICNTKYSNLLPLQCDGKNVEEKQKNATC
jgi:hypothetical protein